MDQIPPNGPSAQSDSFLSVLARFPAIQRPQKTILHATTLGRRIDRARRSRRKSMTAAACEHSSHAYALPKVATAASEPSSVVCTPHLATHSRLKEEEIYVDLSSTHFSWCSLLVIGFKFGICGQC